MMICNRYTYARNCPLMYTDPSGWLYNPIYDKHGNPLGNTSEGFKGVPFIYDGTDKVNWSTMTAEQATKKYNLTELQKTNLSAEAFSKIYTHILKEGGFFTSKLIGKSVAVNNGIDQFNNPNLTTELFSGSTHYPSKITVNQKNSYTGQMLTTVENIWNMLGAHETVGHGQYNFGDATKTHHKAYEYQINHKTWDATTSEYKGLVIQNYLRYLNWEVPGSRSSNEYLKYHNLMNLYLKK